MIHTITCNQVKIWSERFTFTHGWFWQMEQVCTKAESEGILIKYQQNEPSVLFKISKYKPSPRKKWVNSK